MNELEYLFENKGYVLEKLLGKDGLGELYRACYSPHDRGVLLRKFPRCLAEDPAAWAVACAEIQAWARLRREDILQVLDWGTAGSEPYLATELPSGIMLRQALSEEEVLDQGLAFSRLVTSVEAARQWGVLHLGLNLSNVWVGGHGLIQVGEFGLWYLRRDFPWVFDESGVCPGDDLFLAPEQLLGGRASAATDVYALALIFIALRCGLEAVHGAREGLALPEELGLLSAAISRSLDVQPLARFRSAGELAAALELPVKSPAYDDYRDCPVCRLKERIQKESLTGERSRGGGPCKDRPAAYPWLFMAALLVVAFLVWWLAFR